MVELRQGNTKLRLSPTIWMMTLEIGRLCGWVPLGTRRNALDAKSGMAAEVVKDALHSLPWQTDYISSDSQTVTAPDSRGLANALEKASLTADEVIQDWQQGRLQPPAVIRTPSTGFRWFGTPAGKEHLLAVADLCRRGEFQIC